MTRTEAYDSGTAREDRLGKLMFLGDMPFNDEANAAAVTMLLGLYSH